MTEVPDMSDVLLVGELNPHGGDPRFALYDYPEHSAGAHLRRILGLDTERYLAIRRTNLCRGRWTMAEARRKVESLVADQGAPWRRIVMLGRRVAAAFDCADVPAYTSAVRCFDGSWPREFVMVAIPHPSGLNREWDAPGAAERARAAVVGARS